MEKRVCFYMEQFGSTHTKKYQRFGSGIFLSQLRCLQNEIDKY